MGLLHSWIFLIAVEKVKMVFSWCILILRPETTGSHMKLFSSPSPTPVKSLFFPIHNYTESQFTTQKKQASSDPNLREIEGDGKRSKHFCSNWVQTKNFGVAQRKPL
ncbi:hypothetical protein Q8A67_017744 [Cirrhinus molitorella]|uniref:Uncharacterized protein n=1 Tax=Cirrhinus molitorella TaxID=172907 RepID=A0AA88TFY8_9TELE|nr:hypothetical protein Q8A67_017744 [Cirrhinus molitorella]